MDHGLNYQGWKVSWGVLVMSSLFVALLSLTLAISPLQSPFVAPLLGDSWDIVVVSFATFHHAAVMFFLHISRANPTRLCLNCVSTIHDNRATVLLVTKMKLFSYPWCLETVRWTLAIKCGDGTTTGDQWRFALSWTVARQSPPCVKGALPTVIFFCLWLIQAIHSLSSKGLPYGRLWYSSFSGRSWPGPCGNLDSIFTMSKAMPKN